MIQWMLCKFLTNTELKVMQPTLIGPLTCPTVLPSATKASIHFVKFNIRQSPLSSAEKKMRRKKYLSNDLKSSSQLNDF